MQQSNVYAAISSMVERLRLGSHSRCL